MTDENDMKRAPRRSFRRNTWWTAAQRGVSPHVEITSIVQAMRRDQRWRRDAFRRWACAYGERVPGWENDWTYRDNQENVLSVNFLTNTIDTVHADVFKTRTLPMPMTTGGNYLEFKRAQRLGRFFEGLFTETKFFNDVQLKLGLFVLICGTGFVKGFRRDGRVCAKAIPTWDIFIDDVEAKYGEPRSMHQRMLVDRYVLLEQYGVDPEEPDASLYGTAKERWDAIDSMSHGNDDDDAFDTDYAGDQLVVTESWHLPSSKNASDGRHCICIDNATLVDEPWDRPTFPFRWMQSGISMTGIYGQSSVERILPAQLEHDKLSAKFQLNHDLIGRSRIIVWDDADVSTDHLSDENAAIVRVKGGRQPPQEWNAVPVEPSQYQYRASLPEEARSELGVSGFSTQSRVPAGMSNASGKALQLVNEEDDGRHAIPHKMLEQLVLDVADLFIDEAEALSKEDPQFQVLVAGRGKVDELKWKDVRIDREKLVMAISPASALSKTPGAKFQQLMDLRKAGEISSDEFRYMFEMPDIEKMNGVAISDLESIDRKVEGMVFEGDYRDPSPFDNLQLAIKRGSQLYNYFDLEGGVPDERLAMIRQFVDMAVRLSSPPPADGMPPNMPATQPAPGAMPPMPPPAPMGAPPGGMPDPMMGAAPPMATGAA